MLSNATKVSAQYLGGSGDGFSKSFPAGNVVCAAGPSYNSYVGGNGDGYSMSFPAGNVVCAAGPSYNSYVGGNGDGFSGAAPLTNVVCAAGPSYNSYVGGNGDGFSGAAPLTNVVCAPGPTYNFFLGGVADGFSTSAPLTNLVCAPGPSFNFFLGGPADGFNHKILVLNPSCSSAPLPIELVSFTATYIEQSNSVLAAWVVDVQVNNKEFIVEKTLDGINYRQVATIPGAGTYPFTKSYSAFDYNPTIGVSYYRLKQIDMDGNPTVFPPVPIFIGSDPGNSLNMYPNPVGLNAVLVYMSDNENPLNIDILDMVGRTVNSITFNNVASGENTFTINTSGLAQGMYILRATGGQKVFIFKFIKQG